MMTLRYKDFVWPQIPHTYGQSWEQKPKFDGEGKFLGMTPVAGRIWGEGAFYGEGAFGNFQKLVKLFQAGGLGEWEHSLWGKCQGYLTELEMTQEPRDNYVKYRFQFREALADGSLVA